MTDEETLCTALSLLIYGDCLMIKSQEEGEREREREERMRDRWLLDDGPEEQEEGAKSLLFTSAEQKSERHDLMQMGSPHLQVERPTLFIAPMALPSPIQTSIEEARSNSPVPSAIFIRSDSSDDWVIA